MFKLFSVCFSSNLISITISDNSEMEGDNAIRQSIGDNLSSWSKKLNCNGDTEKKLAYKMKFIKELKKLQIAIETDAANQQHYEVETDFFLTVLGKRLKYSGCYFKTPETTLNQAEEDILQLYCERARLSDGMKVMDLGCGWGATGLWVCEKYPNCNVTCISNSSTQAKYINEQAEKRGYLPRLKCITADANTFSTEEKFDRVISIEMFEHMKNYDQLMAQISSWLKPDGLLFLQVLCHREACYHFKTSRNSDTEWMAKHFFTGGTMPSTDLLLYFQKDLLIEDHWNVNGDHYSRTLEAWMKKLDCNKDKVLSIFRKLHGDDAEKQVFNWRMFFIYCSETFAFNGGNEWLVCHQLFKKKPKSNL